jgi:hypothetical protein
VRAYRRRPLAGPTLADVLALAGAGLSSCAEDDTGALDPELGTEVPEIRGEEDLDDPYSGALDLASSEDLPAYAGQEVTLPAEVAEVLVAATEEAGDVEPQADDSFEAGVVTEELSLDVDEAQFEEWDARMFLVAEVLAPAC